MKILLATDKPFAAVAVDGIHKIIKESGHELILLEKYTEKKQLIDAASNANAIIIRSDIIDDEVIKNSKELKIVVRAGAGYDNIDLKSASAHDVVVMNTPGQNSNAVAELVFGLMVMIARKKYDGTSGTELMGKNIGLHAFGNVSKNVARIASGFGMDVYAFDPYVQKDEFEKYNVVDLDRLEDLYKKCEYISLHIPANEQTKKSINYDLLSIMPKNACLINTARKEIINEEDLIRIMEERQDFKYASDIMPDKVSIFEEKFSNRIFFSPKKIGAQTSEANINAGLAAAKQIVNFFKNGDTTFKVN